MRKKKTVKAWAVFDKESQTLARYQEGGEYMISASKIPRRKLHETFVCVPIVITY